MKITPELLKQVGKWVSEKDSPLHGTYLTNLAEELEANSIWHKYEDIPFGAKFQAAGANGLSDDIVYVKLDDGTLLTFGPSFGLQPVRISPKALARANRYVRYWD